MKTIRVSLGNPNYETEISQILKTERKKENHLKRAYLENKKICLEFEKEDSENIIEAVKQGSKKKYASKEEFVNITQERWKKRTVGNNFEKVVEVEEISIIELDRVWILFTKQITQ